MRSLSWQERRLVFVAAPLSEIVAEFNRYNVQKLVIVDADLTQHRFGGTFQATEPLTFAHLLRSADGVPVSETRERILLGR